MRTWQIVLFALAVIALILILSVHAISFFPVKFSAIIGIFLIILSNNFLVINKYGIKISYFFLFIAAIVFGPLVAIVLILPAFLIQIKVATIATNLDFLIEKDFNAILQCFIKSCGLIFLIFAANFIYGAEFITNNLANSFTIIFLILTALLFGKRILLGQNIFHWKSFTPLLTLVLNVYLLQKFGVQVLNYLAGL